MAQKQGHAHLQNFQFPFLSLGFRDPVQANLTQGPTGKEEGGGRGMPNSFILPIALQPINSFLVFVSQLDYF
jgi:hypothetical protein